MVNGRYEYEGEEYVVLEEVPFKHPELRTWVLSFRYMQISSGLKFVREQEEFKRLFKKLEQ